MTDILPPSVIGTIRSLGGGTRPLSGVRESGIVVEPVLPSAGTPDGDGVTVWPVAFNGCVCLAAEPLGDVAAWPAVPLGEVAPFGNV